MGGASRCDWGAGAHWSRGRARAGGRAGNQGGQRVAREAEVLGLHVCQAVAQERGAEAEGAVTLGAGVRPGAPVGAEVLDAGRAVGEALAALRAQVGLLARVDPQVLHQVRAPGKFLATHVAAERLGPQVTSLVAQEAAAEHEPLAAIVAAVGPVLLGLGALRRRHGRLRRRRRRLRAADHGRQEGLLLPAVRALVLDAGRTVTEAFAADAALVGLLPSVRPLVLHQVGALAEALPTLAADGGALAGGDPGPSHLGGGLGCRLSSEGLFPAVSPLVFNAGRAIPEAFATDTALVGLLPGVGAVVLHQVGHLAEALATLPADCGPIAPLGPARFSQDLGATVAVFTLILVWAVSLNPQVIPGLDTFRLGDIAYFIVWTQIFFFLEYHQVNFLCGLFILIRRRNLYILTP